MQTVPGSAGFPPRPVGARMPALRTAEPQKRMSFPMATAEGKRYEVSACRPSQLPELRTLINQVFLTERGGKGDMFEYVPLLYRQTDTANLRVVTCAGRIVGHAGICPRPLRWRGQTFQVGLIGGVCCEAGLRGTGVGTLAMQDAARRTAELGLDFGVLWTGSVRFYTRLGWRHAGRMTIAHARRTSAPASLPVLALRESPFSPDDCHALHAAAGRNGIVRTVEETRRLFVAPGRDVTVAAQDGRLAGYAVLVGATVREVEGDAAACSALLAHAAQNSDVTSVWPFGDARLTAIGQALTMDVKTHPLGMMLVVSRERLLAKVERELGRSLASCGPGDALLAALFGTPTSPTPPVDVFINYLDHV